MSTGETIAVGLCYVEVALFEGASLKDKRSVIKSLLDRAHRKFNVSASEVRFHEAWQRSGMAFCHVSNSTAFTNSLLSQVAGWIESQGDFEVLDIQIQLL